jgi:hypothetical protein
MQDDCRGRASIRKGKGRDGEGHILVCVAQLPCGHFSHVITLHNSVP